MINLFHELSEQCSRSTTEKYSTSFSKAIKLLHKDIRQPIYNIYGFVRFADEIVDSFHQHNKKELLDEFRQATYLAIERKVSLNPILNSFQISVHDYKISPELIDAFFESMEMDLSQTTYDKTGYANYIYGSAEVVGLMCLHVFCEGKKELYEELKPYAQSLGAAFQKVNFLRDVEADYKELNRVYFPNVDLEKFSASNKIKIENDIADDFTNAYNGIVKLPIKARFGVYVAYKYYLSLFTKIKEVNPQSILSERIRIPDFKKFLILVKAGLQTQFKLL
ncbi:MAG: phytoene/squalene synthase family protein [Bacteroidota bacterium]